PDGDRLGAARPPGHERSAWRLKRPSAGAERGRPGAPGLRSRGARRHRSLRRRRRNQHLGGVKRGVGACCPDGVPGPTDAERSEAQNPYWGLLDDVVTIWPLLFTYVCAGVLRTSTVNLPWGRDPSDSTAWALPFRPAATSQATTWRPGLTAVTPKSNLAVWPAPNGP